MGEGLMQLVQLLMISPGLSGSSCGVGYSASVARPALATSSIGSRPTHSSRHAATGHQNDNALCTSQATGQMESGPIQPAQPQVPFVQAQVPIQTTETQGAGAV